jgi:retron-type reverse transcriptase
LANLYLNSLDHAVNENPVHDAKLVRYADDFVLLCRPGKSGPLYERLKRYLEAKKLKHNETKTRVVDSRRESFCFLGFELSNRRSV